MSSIKLQRGFTLVELIVAIVIIGICSVSFMALLASQASRSGEAMIRDQATHIASAYLDEVLQKPFNDPGVVTGRNGYHFIDNYNGLSDNGVHDQFNAPVTALSQFTINVSVNQSSLGVIPASESKRVDVTVQHSSGFTVTLSGYRMQHP